MCENYLDNIGGEGRFNYITPEGWANKKVGIIDDFHNTCVYKFQPRYFEDGQPFDSGVDEDDYPLLAVGIIAYWLKYHTQITDISNIFENYYKCRLEQYLKSKNDTPFLEKGDCWFAKRIHIPQERENLRLSKALFEYISPEDQKRLVRIGQLYLAFAAKKRFEVRITEYQKGNQYVQLYAHVMEWALKCVEYFMLPEEARTGDNPKTKHLPLHIRLANMDLIDICTLDTSCPIYQELENNMYHLNSIDDRKRYLMSIIPYVARFVSTYIENRITVDNARRSSPEFGVDEYDEAPLSSCLSSFLGSSVFFIKNLAGLALSFQIDICDLAEQCGLKLYDINSIESYVDGIRIISKEHARNMLIRVHDEKWLDNQEYIWSQKKYTKQDAIPESYKRIFEFHINEDSMQNLFNQRFMTGTKDLCYRKVSELLCKESIKNKKDFARLAVILYDHKNEVFLGTSMPSTFSECLSNLSLACGVPNSTYDDMTLLRGDGGNNKKYRSFCIYLGVE